MAAINRIGPQDVVQIGSPAMMDAAIGGSTTIYVLNGTGAGETIEGWAEVDLGAILGVLDTGDVLIRAGGGDDTLEGGDGDDVLAPGAGDDTVRGGAGIDCVAYDDANAAVTVDLAAGFGDPVGAGYDTIRNVENVLGSDRNDTLRGDSADNVIDGGAGADLIEGRAGGDTLYGEALRYESAAGADVLRGGRGDDRLYGGNGADELDGGEGNDTLAGEAGNDTATYAGAASAVVVSLLLAGPQNTVGAGTDTLAGIENLTGSAFDDYLFGSDTANTLRGEAGADHLAGNRGDDVLRGGLGGDSLNGGEGVDEASYVGASGGVTVLLAAGTASGADGTDTLTAVENVRGGAHADVLGGDAGRNQLRGFGGDDTLDGGLGDDVLDGGSGADTAVYAFATGGVTVNLATGLTTLGPAGLDRLIAIEHVAGSGFGDFLLGDAGSNRLQGFGGDDVLEGGVGADRLIGDSGFDRATWANAVAGLVIDLVAGTALGAQDADTLDSIEWVVGSRHADTILGSVRAETLDGGDGDDTVTGGNGDDTLIGGGGVDTLRFVAASRAVTVDLAAGTAVQGSGRDAQRDAVSGFEQVTGSVAHGDTLSGSARRETLSGLSGADHLRGRGGDDRLDGGDGIDTAIYDDAVAAVRVDLRTGSATGGAGSDTLVAIENVTGSARNDTLSGDGAVNVLRGLDGADVLEGRGGNDVLDGGAGLDTASYRDAVDFVLVDLAAGQAFFAAGDDTLIGIENATGSSHGDQLVGDDDVNLLDGGGGADTLLGGLGADVLTGGAGADRFVYRAETDAEASLAPIEVVADFLSGSDTLDFSRIDPDAATAGDDAFVFLGSAAFTATGRAELRFENGLLYGDADGDGVAGMILQLPSVAALQVTDLVL